MPEAIAPQGVIPGFILSHTVTVPGPATAIGIVHDPAGVSHSAESRTQPTEMENGQRRHFKEISPVAKRLKSWFGALNESVDPPRMKEAS